MKAVLMLADGKSFSGEAFGSSAEKCGEVILNTAVVGYQEMATEPANAGKILVLTYPLIGNYGTAPKFSQSKKVWLSGLVIKEKSRIYSNWQAKSGFEDFAEANKLLVLSSIDTRTLAVHLRQKGEMPGIISTNCFNSKELLGKLENWRKNNKKSRLPEISVNKITQATKAKGKSIAILDLGVTAGLLRQLELLGLSATLLPYNSPAKDILRLRPKGLIISDGPEEDSGLKEAAANVKELIGRLPILGIATGSQVLAAALGAKINKLKLGHRGVNYPVYNPASYKGEITVQNHCQVIDADSLGKVRNVKISAYNLNDRSVEEFESRKLKFLGVQYIPACPGFDEINRVFTRFLKISKNE